jgi:serine O-acetyltransferase
MIFKAIFETIGYFRLGNLCVKTNSAVIKKICRYMVRKYQHETGSYLPFNNTIDGVMVFPHGVYGVFLSQGCKIGKNCICFQQVTIGSNSLEDSKGFGEPVIGNNVLIGAGAKIIGNVIIGNNCRIGANCVVTIDIPDNSVVVLPKPNIIREKIINNFESKNDRAMV